MFSMILLLTNYINSNTNIILDKMSTLAELTEKKEELVELKKKHQPGSREYDKFYKAIGTIDRKIGYAKRFPKLSEQEKLERIHKTRELLSQKDLLEMEFKSYKQISSAIHMDETKKYHEALEILRKTHEQTLKSRMSREIPRYEELEQEITALKSCIQSTCPHSKHRLDTKPYCWTCQYCGEMRDLLCS